MSHRWNPLLDGGPRERALEAAADIVDALPEPGTLHSGSLAGGEAGLAIVAEYSTRAGLGDYRGTAHEYLASASRSVNRDRPGRGLFEGATGVAWAIEHLREDGEDDPNGEVDAGLVEALDESSSGTYDLIGGLAGLGIYALERGPVADELLRGVVARLSERVERTPQGGTLLSLGSWAGGPRAAPHPERYYNLGLAHGVPGAIGVLGLAAEAGIEGAVELVEDMSRWLLAHEIDDEGSRLPAWVVPGEDGRPGRTAWCYGDPGAAAALIVAGRATGLTSIEQDGLRLASAAAARPAALSRVRDGSLCHGAAGLMHLFNRLTQTTGDATLHDAAREWATRLLDMRQPGQGFGGFLTFDVVDGQESFIADPGVLTGAAGIALALLAAATDVEPGWDRHMLLSARHRGEAAA